MLAYTSGQWTAFWTGVAALIALVAFVFRRVDARRDRADAQTAQELERKAQREAEVARFHVTAQRSKSKGRVRLTFTLNNDSNTTWTDVVAVVVVRPGETTATELHSTVRDLWELVDWDQYDGCSLEGLELGTARVESRHAPVNLAPGVEAVAGLVRFTDPFEDKVRTEHIDGMDPVLFLK